MRESRDRELLADTLAETFDTVATVDPEMLDIDFDCCVLDYGTYNDVGEIARQRAADATGFLPFVLLLSDGRGRSRQAELLETVDDVIDLPIEPEVLLARIRNLVERRQTSLALADRTAELASRNERLDTFASIVSHDLRNPLQVAEGHLELAAETTDSDHLAAIDRALDRMRSLIENLLVLARDGTDPSGFESIDLGQLAEESWRNVATESATLSVETDRSIRGDQSQLRHLLENLIRNAVEHGGDSVTVTIGALPDGFFVEDDGPGIPEPDRETVLDSGYSSESTGTGLGLAIVRQVATAHDWELRVTESEAGGARFEFSGVRFV